MLSLRINALRLCVLYASALAMLPGQQLAIDLDSAKTKIEFTVSDVLHTVHGNFTLKSGRIDFNPESRTISGLLLADAASGDSGSGARDGRMKRNILETDKYPEITFAPTSVSGQFSGSASSGTVAGLFTIHGQQHQLSIPVNVRITGNVFNADGEFTVPYVAWGMKNPSTLFLRVKDEVRIAFAAVGAVTRKSGT